MKGWRISGYVAEELVGFGGSGEVWRGRVARSEEPVALKRLRAADESARARLRREATLLAALDHPHLVRVRECVRTDEADVLVMDYAPRGSLAALLRMRRQLTPGEVVTVIAPIAAALAHAHGEGLVHGDVTASNILFAADGRPVLTDLGVSRVLADRGAVHATPDYVDPVVARGAAPGQVSDVFSLAAVAFHALTGLPPWNAATVDDTIAVAAGGEVPDLVELAPQVPAQLVHVLRRALSPEPSARGSAAELALDVRHACPPEPVAFTDAPASVGPAAARPSAQTHAVRTRPTIDTARPKHRTTQHGSRRWAAGLRRMVGNRGLRAGVLGVLAVAGAVRIGVAWADAGADAAAKPPATTVAEPTPRPTPTPTPTPTAMPTVSPSSAPSRHVSARRTPQQRWADELRRLDASREIAFARVDPLVLDRIYTADSPARTADATTMRQLRAADAAIVGVRHRIHRVRVVSQTDTMVRLDATQSLAAYLIQRPGADGEEVEAAPPRHYRITLVRTDGGWRINALSRL